MRNYKVVYEGIDGNTKVRRVQAKSAEEAESWVMNHYADYFQTIAVQEDR